MAVGSESSLMPPDCLLRPESDDEESFVVLGHSLSPESTDEYTNDLADAIETSAVDDTVKTTTAAFEQMNTSTPSFPFMQQLNSGLTRDVSLHTVTTNASVDLSPDEVQQKVDMLVEENFKLKETLHQNNLAMKKQYDTLVLWQNDVMSVHKSHKEKFAETKTYIEKLKLEKAELINILHLKEAEITVLQEQLNEIKCIKAASSIKQISRSSFDNLIEFELEGAKKKILELEQQLKDEKSKLVSEISSKEIVNQQLKDSQAELVNLKLNNEQLDKELIKQKREAESLQKILLDEIKGLKDKLMAGSVEKQNHEKIGEQLMAAQMHITELQLSSDRDKDIINANEQKIQQLDLYVTELKADNEALQVQVDVFGKDFQAEQQAKQALVGEKEKIAEDLRNIQRRNQQLLEDLEKARNHDYVFVSTEPNTASAPQEKIEYICPKCSRQYPNYATLEDHVYRCIEIDSLF